MQNVTITSLTIPMIYWHRGVLTARDFVIRISTKFLKGVENIIET